MKKLLVSGLIALLAGLTVLAAGCQTGASTPLAPASTTGPAARLAFTTQPVGGTAGQDFATAPVVAIEDAEGNVLTGYRALVELTVTPGGASGPTKLLGATKKISDDGVVVFKSLSVNKAGTFSLTATGGTLAPATSQPFSIAPGQAEQLTFTSAPTGGIAGSPLTPPPVVTVEDRYGNAVTDYAGSVTLAATVTLPSGTDQYTGETQMQTSVMPIGGTVTVPVVGGEASFTDVWLKQSIPGYQLVATSRSLQSATTGFFQVFSGAPVKLEFTVQPGGATAGAPFETQPKVAVEDAYDNVVNSSRAEITVAVTPGSGTAGAVLSGATTLVAADVFGGVAEFTDLSIDLVGTGYTLTAMSQGLTTATSQSLDVAPPATTTSP